MGALLAAGLPYEAIRAHTPEQVAAILEGLLKTRQAATPPPEPIHQET